MNCCSKLLRSVKVSQLSEATVLINLFTQLHGHSIIPLNLAKIMLEKESLTQTVKKSGGTPDMTNHDAEHHNPQLTDGLL